MNANDIKIIREVLSISDNALRSYTIRDGAAGSAKKRSTAIDGIASALAALDRLEAQQHDIAKLIEAGDSMFRELAHIYGSGITQMTAWTIAKSAATAQQQPKRLTDDTARSLAKHFNEILKEGHGFTKIQLFEAAIVYARDNGYLGGLSVEEVMEALGDWITDPMKDLPMEWRQLAALGKDRFRARLTAKLNGR
jgi:hypothetical protein